MTAIREIARAKINLTLSVIGRRPDGYHEIESLVTFADLGDGVSLEPGSDARVTTSGPFAAAIDGPNLLEKALALLREIEPGLRLGAVALEKNLPVAAGLGGGSADAAALLRAVRRANPDLATPRALGCRGGAARRRRARLPCRQAGAASRASARKSSPWRTICRRWPPSSSTRACRCPRRPSTGPSLRRPRRRIGRRRRPPGPFAGLDALIDYMRARGNDLERPATSLLPVIADLKAALAALPGCLSAGLSGSGPTCFGIFADEAEATRAAAMLDCRPSCLLDQIDAPRLDAQYARLTQKPMTSASARVCASSRKMASASRAIAP